MGYDDRNAPYSKGDFFRNIGWMLAGGVAVAVLVVGSGGLRLGDRARSFLQDLFHSAQPEPKADVQSVVVQQVRGVSELTTAVFTMQAVVPTSQDATFNGFVIGTTKLLYIAYGEVRAGVDLHSLTPANVQVTGSSMQIQLPPPQLLDRKIDVGRSTVYDYSRGTLGLGPDVAPALQALAQQEALKKIVEAACTDGVLEKANDRAKLAVTQLLTTAGYQNVTVTTQPPSSGNCPAILPSK
ncbi:DUF4230 domain-containing protein [Stenomitos frigidus]|uniref:DUF4230 domain-containing protein n=1 Tax=Stenomitos frigidus ULC18 TaxID=2107698 RepID=A0A2T1E2J1_9CYAN|nr:DUF4230 domain-containing protein [Stenomitos frigidus]PSB26955.1 DUF4230 domain-containing protein [Stenomitos frigidus ULC18]